MELHGRYSVERMHQLQVYSRRSSLTRALFVIFLTPLPCVLIVILVDLIPLEAPDSGLAHSHAFWLRMVICLWVINFSNLEQGRHYISTLPVTVLQIAHLTTVVATGGVAMAFGWASLIDYPLPFFPCFAAPGCMLLTAISSTIIWGKHVRGNPTMQAEIINYFNFVGVPISLIFIYPGYNHVFMRLTASQQTEFALLLPVIKILAKNAIGYLARHLEDCKPEVVIFNIEISHALFIASSMQQSNSICTTIVLMAMDFVQACASLHDIDLMLKSLRELIEPSPDSINGQQRGTSNLNALDAAMYLLSIDKQLRSNASLRLNSQAKMRSSPARIVIWPQESRQPGPLLAAISILGDENKPLGRKVSDKAAKSRAAVHPGDSNQRAISVGMILDALAGTTCIRDVDKQRLQLLSSEARLEVVQKTLQLLHLTEFLLLIEFTEVIVPCIYCVFVGVVSHMPNQQFYSNLRDLDNDSLLHNISKILVYASLEILSCVILAVLLARRLRISSLKQLAFVLEVQWQVVQTKLVVWVLFSLQTTLVHMGMDYSFHFAWLHKGA